MPQTLPMPADTLPTSAHRALAPVIIDGVTTPAPSAHSTTRANNHTDMSHTAMNQFTNHHTGLDHNGLEPHRARSHPGHP